MSADATFHERLLPGAGPVAGALGLGALAMIILLPISVPVAIVAGVVVAVALVVTLVATAPVVAVHDGELWAGRAHVPVALLGEVVALTARERVREELGPRLDARAHVVLRSWVPRAVRVALQDPADPTPYWLVSTRRPDELAVAVAAARAAGGSTAKAATPEA